MTANDSVTAVNSVSHLADFVSAHCVDCHSGSDAEADVRLDELQWQQPSQKNAASIELVLRVLRDRRMPPADATPPDPHHRGLAIDALDQRLRSIVADLPRPAGSPMRRMNRFQYANAVRDLFDLRISVFTLPEQILRRHSDYFHPSSHKLPDTVYVGCRPLGKSQLIQPRLAGVAPFPQDARAEHGFDNRGDHLTLSPLLMESFLRLSGSITHSPDFTARNVGVWKQWFAEPGKRKDRIAALRQRLRPMLRRAFRKPCDPKTLQRYVDYASRHLDDGESFPETMKNVAAAVIASPHFLYLHNDTSRPASQLSFFLWGSLPDERLLKLEQSGRLNDPEVRRAEAIRMMNDKRSSRFCDSFPAQWLQLERIIASVPNPQQFPQFYFSKYRDSMHMVLEPLLLFETVYVENRSIVDLLDPDFTYRSTHLRETYGEKVPKAQRKGDRGNVQQLRFVRMPLDDRRYGGVITNAAVMTMTSGPQRTQPITRGAWVASVIFNDPPKPPPADVPPLPESDAHDATDTALTLRQQLAEHRERSDCRGCHESIDPLGFALENYDPIGMWREQYAGNRSIDVSGTLFGENEFQSAIEFKNAIADRKDRFAQALTQHLASFAQARALTTKDRTILRDAVEGCREDDYRIRDLIAEMLSCELFEPTTQ
ncbi:MAG: DUF1588 domain-containing protein [Planctomycetota bacterium]